MALRRIVSASVALVAIALATPAAQAAPEHRRSACPGARELPTAGNLPEIREAILCLHNRARRGKGLPALRDHRKLRKAAERHSEDMVQRGYFEHESADGRTFDARIEATGYRAYTMGENIAWGTGHLATPIEIHRAWMESPGHRANILRREYREIGIGVALGVPVDEPGMQGATFTADFGRRG